MRIGQGYDVHRLVKGRKLILGGVEIPYELGLEGHSDADVLTHAVMDALLGAAGLRDIGYHFPPSDNKYKDADSLQLLQRVVELIREGGYINISNVDATIVAEAPKLSEYIPTMQANLARALDIKAGQVAIKATTSETLGFTGRGEGIAALAICLIK